MKLPFLTSPGIYNGEVTDADAAAFIAAAGITNQTQKVAINSLVVALKNYGLWTKMTAIYPFVGGTDLSHSYNLKNTAQFQITWNGVITHNVNGITGNGTSGYGNLNLSADLLDTNSNCYSLYSRTTGTSGASDFGNLNSSISLGSNMAIKFTDNNTHWSTNDSAGVGFGNLITTDQAAGFFTVNRTSSNNKRLYRNSALLSSTTSSATSNNYLFVICARINYPGLNISNYSNRNYSFCCLGGGLTDAEASNLYTAVQSYQTRLGRQV